MSDCLLRDAFAGWEDGNGIFPFIEEIAVMPWAEEEFVDSVSIDIDYFAGHSGSKFCTPLVKSLLNGDEELSAESRTKIAKIIVSKYYPSWKSLWFTNIADYNPIHNYDMTENRTLHGANSQSEVGNSTTRNTGTDTTEYGRTETTTHGKTNDTTYSKYGINTVDISPRPSEREQSREGGDTVIETGGSDVQTKNLTNGTDSTNNTVAANEEVEELRRAGNIGVTTTQQMLESERRLRMWNYFDQIYKDLDKELALAIHDPCKAW